MAKEDFNFFLHTKVRYSEVDHQGIVYNSHYLGYADEATVAYLNKINFNLLEHSKQHNRDFHAVKTTLEYFSALGPEDEMDVCVKVGKIGNSSLTFNIEIYSNTTNKLTTKCELIWVYTNQETHKSEKLPDELINKIKTFQSIEK
tara:strand:+ start:748 stop:1182 length:435 start_codon:yes stop_codon:yes gene_type:complete